MSWVESPGSSDRYDVTDLTVDEALLNVTNYNDIPLWLYELSKDCKECPFTKVKIEDEESGEMKDVFLDSGENVVLTVLTRFQRIFRLEKNGSREVIPENDKQGTYCTVDSYMGEFGAYELTAESDGCKFETAVKPVSIYLPFLIPIFFYIGLAIVIFLVQKYKYKIFGQKKTQTTDQSVNSQSSGQIQKTSTSSAPPVAAPSRQRLRSLDTFRGISIIIMIFVNDGGAGYYFLEHATWDGLYVADLVFPWFLWIMGVCIPVSIKSQVKRSTPKLIILKNIAIRSCKLIAIGIMLNSLWGPVLFRELRIFGVLQRFGICYFVVATTVLICANKDFVSNRKANNKYIAAIQDIHFLWKGWAIMILIVTLHTCLTFFLKVPGCPTGYLGPGGLHEDNAHAPECIGGAAGYIDRKILTLKHLYQHPTARDTYRSGPYDPEGILGTLTSIFNVWLGVQAGLTLQVYPKHRSRLVRWAIWAVLTGAIGALLCGAKQTGGPIPLNKNLWSLSFVFVLSSFALILLMGLYVTIDMLKFWSGTPFFEPGMNSILLYIGHSVANSMLPWHFRFNKMNTHFKLLVESLWGTSLWVVYAIYLFHKKFFWSL